jgi:hypothetical protein
MVKANVGKHMGDLGVNEIMHRKNYKTFRDYASVLTMNIQYVVSSLRRSSSHVLGHVLVLYSQLCHLNSSF